MPLRMSENSMTLDFSADQVGAFSNISNETYHDEILYAYSKSDMDAVEDSPANLLLKRNGPKPDSDALLYGNVFHALIEHHERPAEFQKLYGVAVKGTTKEAIAAKAAQRARAVETGMVFVDPKVLEELETKLAAVKAHPETAAFLKYKGICEETLIWKDKETGLFLKCRPDRRLLEAPRGLPNNLVVDWKTLSVPQGKTMKRAIEDVIDARRYHVQAAMIIDGIKAVLGLDVGMFVNVFVEKGDSSRVLCTTFRKEKIEEGRRAYRANLQTIAECTKNNLWPGIIEVGHVWSRE